MDEKIRKALERAGAARSAATAGVELVGKALFSSPAGKRRLAPRLVKLIPAHKTYVEPFAGGAAVLFEKERSAVEVLNDLDNEIADAFSIARDLSSDGIAKLKAKDWIGNRDTFYKLRNARPTDPVEKLYRFLYVSRFSFGKVRSGYSPNDTGVRNKSIAKIEESIQRLKGVRIMRGDYEKAIRKYDALDSFFFLDPPYGGSNGGVMEKRFDEARFIGVLKSIKGKFMVNTGYRGQLVRLAREAGFTIKRMVTRRRAAYGRGGPPLLSHAVITNYELTAKSIDGIELLDDFDTDPAFSDDVAKSCNTFTATSRLIKGIDPSDERYVLGIVLEPETIDAQSDIYSEAEIRQAAHRFMEDFGGLGLMHRTNVNGRVKVLESYLAPTDLEISGQVVKRGTWLLAVRVLDDALWDSVKSGTLTGFSIGGSARRVPETQGP